LENKSSDGGNPVSDRCVRYKFTVSYDGTLYWGFQRQVGCNTVQAELESALQKLGWNEAHIVGAGRTDSGVHAEGQVFSAAFCWNHSLSSLIAAMNSYLPKDIAIKAVEPVPDSFHARFDATSRCYHYHIYHSETRDPLKDRFCWQVWPELDLKTLNKAAVMLIGEHDFRAFGSPPRKNGRTVRTVLKSCWYETSESGRFFEVEADAFLYHMVRRMVYLQIQVAADWMSWDSWQNSILTAENAKPGIAPANGLKLNAVSYDRKSWNESNKTVKNSKNRIENYF
jgi:tRNA pseudouridine38-40 synthase